MHKVNMRQMCFAFLTWVPSVSYFTVYLQIFENLKRNLKATVILALSSLDKGICTLHKFCN
jgi:hypothetical protein